MKKKIYEVIKNPAKIAVYIQNKCSVKLFPDSIYLKMLYKIRIGKKLNLSNPKTFNEKLQWLKLYDRKPIYSTMVDKYEAKKYVAEIIGQEYIIPTLGIWDRFEDIDFNTLPNQFVLKCTHDSGGLVICKDKSAIDLDLAKRKINDSLKKNYYLHGREWPYKNVKPRIIAEKYMDNDENDIVNNELLDYKMMCFNGKVMTTFICSGRHSKDGLHVTFYDTSWKRMPFERHYAASKYEFDKPKSYNEMVMLAEKLAKDIPFVRVDFYEIQGKVYFGELTFFPGNGLEEFRPESWDYKLGSWLKLPTNYNR